MARSLGLLLAATLFASACGGEETVSAGGLGSDPEQGGTSVTNQPDDDGRNNELPTTDELPFEEDPDGEDELPADEEVSMPDEGEDSGSDGQGFQPATPSSDMISAEHAVIDSVEPLDELTLGVRYWNGSEPCAQANVIVTESDTSVTVRLETGLHPNVAAMSCVAETLIYEMPVTLAEPLGDREIVLDEPAGTSTDEDLEPAPTEQYLGLSLADAEALAAEQGRAFRVVRQDDEQFAVTEDYSPDRVNVEVDDGIVTGASAG